MIITKKMPNAIIFFGPDGSGKTTQADMLVKDLQSSFSKSSKSYASAIS